MPKIKFGKHKGERFTDLPTSYLKWILDPRHNTYVGKHEVCLKNADIELKRRESNKPMEPPAMPYVDPCAGPDDLTIAMRDSYTYYRVGYYCPAIQDIKLDVVRTGNTRDTLSVGDKVLMSNSAVAAIHEPVTVADLTPSELNCHFIQDVLNTDIYEQDLKTIEIVRDQIAAATEKARIKRETEEAEQRLAELVGDGAEEGTALHALVDKIGKSDAPNI